MVMGDPKHRPQYHPAYEPVYQGTSWRGLELGFPGSQALLELEVTSPVVSDLFGFSSDNGPCKQVCSVIGDTAMCSCFPGYAIMADGVSCEGEYTQGHSPMHT